MPIKLSVPERHILYTVLMNARLTVPEIARQVGTSAPVVQHALRKFKVAGLISHRVMIDIFRLGYASHDVYLTLSSEGQRTKAEIAQFLARSGCATMVLEVGGEYDFFVRTVTRTSAQLAAFNHELSAKFGSLFLKKDVAVMVRHSVFGEKMLVNDPKLHCECFFEVDPSATPTPLELDSMDHRLLYALTDPELSSSRALAQSLGLPVSTLVYRLKKLEAAEIIAGDMHEIRGELIGLANYIVLVSMKGVSQANYADFFAFAKSHPNITHLTFEVGHWDYMVGVAVEQQRDLNLIIDAIRGALGDSVASIKSFSMFFAHKVRDYPSI
jgi:DNA-binding Lrp family transcriptional regulator